MPPTNRTLHPKEIPIKLIHNEHFPNNLPKDFQYLLTPRVHLTPDHRNLNPQTQLKMPFTQRNFSTENFATKYNKMGFTVSTNFKSANKNNYKGLLNTKTNSFSGPTAKFNKKALFGD
jgi:hypothetical protein